MSLTIERAARMANELLRDVEPRLSHVRGAAERAFEIGRVVSDEDRPTLIAAAYLHDIGYSPAVRRLGVHQLDGAGYLRKRGHERLARLVAHHSESRFELELCGYADLLAQYEPEGRALQDALTYCDLTTSAMGERTLVESRLAEVESRYSSLDGADARKVLKALSGSRPYLERAVARVERRLRQATVT